MFCKGEGFKIRVLSLCRSSAMEAEKGNNSQSGESRFADLRPS